MAAMTEVQTPTPEVRHEAFCLPTGNRAEVRIERFAAVSEDPVSGKSRPTHDVTRCIECGAATYTERN